MVRISASQAGDVGSNPVGATKCSGHMGRGSIVGDRIRLGGGERGRDSTMVRGIVAGIA